MYNRFNATMSVEVGNTLAGIVTGNYIFCEKEYLREKDILLTMETIDLFDALVTTKDSNALTKEQLKVLESYLNEDVSELNSVIDEYYGGYLGEENEYYKYTDFVRRPNVVCKNMFK